MDKTEQKLAIAKMATDIMIAVMQDRSGWINKLGNDGRAPSEIMQVFDNIYNHLANKLTEQ